MFRIIIAAALLLVGQSAVASASTACSGADPAIVSVVVKSVTRVGALNRYLLQGRIVNLGGTAQASNVLQFVDIYGNRAKLNDRGIPPLKPGQSYTFSYVSSRSHQAGRGTTTLVFKMDMRQPAGFSAQDCNPNDRFTIRF